MTQSIKNARTRVVFLFWQQTFEEAVHEYNFKNGVFKQLITADTPPLKSIAIFCASDLLSDTDKQHFREIGRLLAAIYSTGAENPSDDDVQALCRAEEKIEAIFKEDMEKQGISVTETLLVHHLGKNGEVKSPDEIREKMEREKSRGVAVKDELEEDVAETTADKDKKGKDK